MLTAHHLTAPPRDERALFFKSNELPTTVKEDSHMAIHAHSGLRTMPYPGNSKPAATGIITRL